MDIKLVIALIVIAGLIAAIIIMSFGKALLNNERKVLSENHLTQMISYFEKVGMKSNPLWHLSNAEAEQLQRRNEFWTTYVQTIIALVIIIVITLLIVSKNVTAEAGLPIISGVSGFVIAKTVNNKNSANDGS
jgi:hypothetical protein